MRDLGTARLFSWSPIDTTVRQDPVATERAPSASIGRWERMSVEDVPVAHIGWCEGVIHRRAPLSEDGSPDPARRIILLHGLGDAPFSWYRCLATALPEHELLLPALPGVGRGPLPDGNDHLTHAQTTEWLLGLLNELQNDDDAPRPDTTLVGHSIGGWLINKAMLQDPELPATLDNPPILINTAGTYYPEVYKERDILSPRRLEDLDELIARIYHTDPGLPIEALDVLLSSMKTPAYRGLLDSPDKSSFLDAAQLQRLPANMGIIWGLSDRLVPPEAFQILCNNVGEPRVITIPDCGHAPHIEAPTALTDALAQLVGA